ncbi:fatty acid synthase-like [Planococcus citri]|uniref:fatty acid synthase-like n=1 Tax=Planococcus citri TaxID=170843 RepID=UPI0031F7FB52
MDDPESIVISGISGVFPSSENMERLKENLLSGKDMIQPVDRYGVRPSCGVNTACSSSMYALDMAIKFIQSGQCEAAIVCSTNFCFASSEYMISNPVISKAGISAPFDADGTYTYLNISFNHAFNARSTALLFNKFTFLLGGGYVRSEAVVSMFVQKQKHARRVYANIIHSMTNCDGFKKEGFSYPSVTQQKHLYEQFYKAIDIDPRSVSYVEAHGTGTPVGDVVEGTSIEEFFCKGRTTPLRIGSTKSNIGHTEASAALCAIAKIIVSFETGLIPPNLHFKNPNPNIKGLHNGQLQVVTKPTPLQGEYFALNSFGIGGANGHLLLKPNNKIKKSKHAKTNEIPRIVTVSGRTEEAVDCILNDIEKNCNDEEYLELLHEIFSENISGHLQRGFIILQENQPPIRSKTLYSGEERPVWFVFSGMGSQWPTMGKSLMNIPAFAESICKSHKILLTKNIDLIRIITEDDPTLFDNILNAFLGIAAIQVIISTFLKFYLLKKHTYLTWVFKQTKLCIDQAQSPTNRNYSEMYFFLQLALVDVLASVGIKPDGIIGHSVGELGCAYADGCFSAEQLILSAYSRGIVTPETEIMHGTMASVGAGYETMKDKVPEGVEIACHNSPTNCTISGPTELVLPFIEKIKEQKIFVRRINTANIAYHSRCIASFGSKLLSHMQDVVPEPKLRSKKWICTSAPESKWDTDLIKYSSAEYHTNNLLSSVLFEEGCRHIPSNAITIEIAPHGLLNAILQQSLPKTVTNITLTMKNHKNAVEYLLNSLGRLYEVGCLPKIGRLYPQIEFPVSRSTPMISPLIKWQHDEKWPVGRLTNEEIFTEQNYMIRSYDDKFAFIKDHIIDGRNFYPGLGYLWLVLQTFASIQKTTATKTPVIFENIRFERATNVPKKGSLMFHVSIHMSTNNFEVTEKGTAVATGTIRIPENIDRELVDIPPINNTASYCNDELHLNSRDFYKELRLRGYQYRGMFKTVARSQFKYYDAAFPVHFYPHHNLLSSGGIQMMDWSCNAIARQKNMTMPLMKKYQFVPYISDEIMELNEVINVCILIILENMLETQVKTFELLENENYSIVSSISSMILDVLQNIPMIRASVNISTTSQNTTKIEVPAEINISNEKLPGDKSSTLVALSNILNKTNIVKTKPNHKVVQLFCDSYTWISKIQNELVTIDSEKNEKLIVYAKNDPKNGILGFFNCIRREAKGKLLRCIYVMDKNMADFSLENTSYKSQLDKNLSHNVYKNGEWGCYRHLSLLLEEDVTTPHTICTLGERGNFSSFKWIEGHLNPLTKNGNKASLVHVYYSSLNFRDVLLSIGKLSALDMPCYSRLISCMHGVEFSGKNDNGTPLMGIVRNTGLATLVESVPELTWIVPEYMTLEEAATIPIIYATVVYAFFLTINLKKGSSILIHAGSGGIGQAAINICLHYKCNIFTTVGTPEKVQFIRKTFPQIPESHIGNSRDTSFEKLIKQQTNGRGVDIVLNSLSEEKLQASIRCLAVNGHFLEIGKFDIFRNNTLGKNNYKIVIYPACFFLSQCSMQNNQQQIHEIKNKMQDMLNQGIIKPIHRIIFHADEVESAFRCMAAGKHIGKVLIKIRDEEKDRTFKPTVMNMKAKAQIICHELNSYIVIGGLGGVGMELADWLIIRGARNIVLSSRTGIKNGYQSYRIKLWRSYGVNVVISTEDITKEAGVKKLLQTAITLGPVEGIFNLAVILKDDSFNAQTEETFNTVLGPKATATMHLDKLSRSMCPHLKHFVVFSSIACGFGNRDQTNYGYANSAMERICENRHADNLPALAVQWGAIGDVGIVADFVEEDVSVVICGTLLQKITSCLETLNLFVKKSTHPIVASMVIAEKHNSDSNVISAVANILGIKDLKLINQSWTLPELGMDSIVGMEIKQILDSEFNKFFTADDLRTMTFAKLYKMKDETENMPETDEKIKTQLQVFMDERIMKNFILKIPLNEKDIEKPIVFNENSTVFMFPGVEGMVISMESLAKCLPGQTLCFQYHFGSEKMGDFSITKLVDYFADYILKNYNFSREFCFIGHSLGGLIAMKVADILEKCGKTGILYLIESSPILYQKLYVGWAEKEGSVDDEHLQNETCIRTMETVLPSINTTMHAETIKSTKDWESKKKLCFSLLTPASINVSLVDKIFDRIYSFARALTSHEFTQVSLQSSCVLIRCIENPFDLDDDLGLTEYFKKPVQIHKIDAGHTTILNHPKTSEIILQSPLWRK